MRSLPTSCWGGFCLMILVSCAGQGQKPVVKKTVETTVPSTPDVTRLFDEALAQLQAEEPGKARATLDAIIDSSPDFVLARLERGQLLVEAEDDAPLALADTTMAATVLADNPRAHLLHGQALEQSGDDAAAAAAYRRSLALRSEVTLRRRLAVVLERAGERQESIEVWETLRDETPDDVGVRLALAESYEKADRPASAEAEWSEIARLASSNSHLLRRFADFLDRQGKVRQAGEVRTAADEQDAPQQRQLRPLLPSPR